MCRKVKFSQFPIFALRLNLQYLLQFLKKPSVKNDYGERHLQRKMAKFEPETERRISFRFIIFGGADFQRTLSGAFQNGVTISSQTLTSHIMSHFLFYKKKYFILFFFYHSKSLNDEISKKP